MRAINPKSEKCTFGSSLLITHRTPLYSLLITRRTPLYSLLITRRTPLQSVGAGVVRMWGGDPWVALRPVPLPLRPCPPWATQASPLHCAPLPPLRMWRSAPTNVTIRPKKPPVESPVGAGVVWMRGGDACVALVTVGTLASPSLKDATYPRPLPRAATASLTASSTRADGIEAGRPPIMSVVLCIKRSTAVHPAQVRTCSRMISPCSAGRSFNTPRYNCTAAQTWGPDSPIRGIADKLSSSGIGRGSV